VPEQDCQDNAIPLSAEQESYLEHDDSHGAATLAFRVQGRLDLPSLRHALAAVVARHEPLRMRLTDTPEGTRQVFGSAGEPVIHEIPVSDGAAAEELGRELALRHAELRAGGLAPARTWLIRWAPFEALLLVLIDPLATDTWGMSVFATELWICYHAAATRSGPPPLKPAPRYSDHVAAQRAATWAPAQRDYWQQVARDYCAQADPCARPDAPGDPGQPDRSDLTFTLSPGHQHQMAAFARAIQAPPGTVELAGLLLAMWARHPAPAVSVWRIHHGRDDAALAHAVGVYHRALPLVVPVRPEATLTEFTRDVLRRWTDAVGYSDMPYSTAGMRQLIARAADAGQGTGPEVLLVQPTATATARRRGPVPIGRSIKIEWRDLTVKDGSSSRGSRLRIIMTPQDTPSARVMFSPGTIPPEFAGAVLGQLEKLLPLFAPQNADHLVGQLADQVLSLG
jgi:hypothetical protein